MCVFGGECEPLDTGMDGDGSWRESIRAWELWPKLLISFSFFC